MESVVPEYDPQPPELPGERRLWLRVWWRAVCDYVLYRERTTPKQRKLADSAADWLFGESCFGTCPPECEDARLSFDAFCEEYDLKASDVRTWIRTLQPEDVYKIGRNLP
jgi:hypothetical protein